jgi:hypothetical protein
MGNDESQAARLFAIKVKNVSVFLFKNKKKTGGWLKSNRDVTDTGAGRSGEKGRRQMLLLRHPAPPRD